MKKNLLLVPALAAGLASACIELDGGRIDNPRKFSASYDVECVCGGEGNLAGCFHEKCINGENNPDNPDCVCGGLTATPAGRTQTSTGKEAPSTLLGRSQILYLANGNTVRGVLVADNGLSIELEGGDGNTRTYAYDALDARSIYRLRKGRAPGDNAGAQIEVGNYARDVGYYAHARRHYQQAVDADPSVEDRVDGEMARLRQLASQAELTAASDALGKGDTKAAEKHIATILTEFPGETAAKSAAEMLNDIQAREASTTRSVPDTSAQVAADFGKAQEAYERAVAANREGLLGSRNQSRAIRSFESALKASYRVQKELDTVRKRNRESAPHQRLARQLDADVIALIVETDLNMVSVYMTRNDYKKALERANHALAVDPGNAEAKQARARIEAASGDDGWGWGYGGRLRPRPAPYRR